MFFQAQGICTVRFAPEDNVLAPPVVQLGTATTLLLQFDEMNADTHTLFYSFVHCDAQWRPSDIMEMDFFDGFNKVYNNENARFSFNTTADYVHYDVLVTTDELKISGNYLLNVYADEDGGRLLLTRPLMVYEPMVGIDSRVEHLGAAGAGRQDVSFAVRHPQLKIGNVQAELKTVVWQNSNIADHRMVGTPAIIRADNVVYEGNAQLSFEAGNEWRWLDNRNLKYPQMNTKAIEYHDPYYHFVLYPDGRPRGYSYHEDFNGKSYIEARNISDDPEIAADYTLVHFALPSADGGLRVRIAGDFDPEGAAMQYQPELKAYTAVLWLKQGLYNYRYEASANGRKASAATFEGSFAETENDYHIAIYYRSYGDVYDRLVGYKCHNTLKTPDSFVH